VTVAGHVGGITVRFETNIPITRPVEARGTYNPSDQSTWIERITLRNWAAARRRI